MPICTSNPKQLIHFRSCTLVLFLVVSFLYVAQPQSSSSSSFFVVSYTISILTAATKNPWYSHRCPFQSKTSTFLIKRKHLRIQFHREETITRIYSETKNPSTTTTTNISSGSSIASKWVIENLEVDSVPILEPENTDRMESTVTTRGSTTSQKNMIASTRITTDSDTKAGENDSLPMGGLSIGPFRILPSLSRIEDMIRSYPVPENEETHISKQENETPQQKSFAIRLFQSRNGWGTGVHPTTRLCLEWMSLPNIIQQGSTMIDYGCGSGILSVAALQLGCSLVHGIDVEAEALISSERNVQLNILQKQSDAYDDEIETTFKQRFAAWHAREIVPYGLRCENEDGKGADICVANILIGQLVRPSMVSAIVTNLSPGAWLCLSGIRPDEVHSLKAAYHNYVEWEDHYYQELAAVDTEGSLESYGFDVGTWARVVGRIKMNVRNAMDSSVFSEQAVS